MTRLPRSPLDAPTLGHRLQWHAGQCAQRGVWCSVLVLQPLGHADQALLDGLPDGLSARGDGPSTLSQVAGRLRLLLRCTDVVEVEESLGIGILLYDADADGARAVCERLRRDLAQPLAGRLRRGAVVEELHLAVGRATAEPADVGRIPALVRELVEDAITPDIWLSVPLVRGAAPEPGTEAVRRAAHGGSRNVVPSSRRTAEQPQLCVLPPELAARAATDEGEELRRQADVLGVPYVCLPDQVAAPLRRFIPAPLAAELGAVPIGHTRGVLTVAMRDPLDQCAVRRLAEASRLTIFPVLAAPSDLARAMAQLDPKVACSASPARPDAR